jgi:hypothetical protein
VRTLHPLDQGGKRLTVLADVLTRDVKPLLTQILHVLDRHKGTEGHLLVLAAVDELRVAVHDQLLALLGVHSARKLNGDLVVVCHCVLFG